jgi:hypothetical protein
LRVRKGDLLTPAERQDKALSFEVVRAFAPEAMGEQNAKFSSVQQKCFNAPEAFVINPDSHFLPDQAE